MVEPRCFFLSATLSASVADDRPAQPLVAWLTLAAAGWASVGPAALLPDDKLEAQPAGVVLEISLGLKAMTSWPVKLSVWFVGGKVKALWDVCCLARMRESLTEPPPA